MAGLCQTCGKEPVRTITVWKRGKGPVELNTTICPTCYGKLPDDQKMVTVVGTGSDGIFCPACGNEPPFGLAKNGNGFRCRVSAEVGKYALGRACIWAGLINPGAKWPNLDVFVQEYRKQRQLWQELSPAATERSEVSEQ